MSSILTTSSVVTGAPTSNTNLAAIIVPAVIGALVIGLGALAAYSYCTSAAVGGSGLFGSGAFGAGSLGYSPFGAGSLGSSAYGAGSLGYSPYGAGSLGYSPYGSSYGYSPTALPYTSSTYSPAQGIATFGQYPGSSIQPTRLVIQPIVREVIRPVVVPARQPGFGGSFGQQSFQQPGFQNQYYQPRQTYQQMLRPTYQVVERDVYKLGDDWPSQEDRRDFLFARRYNRGLSPLGFRYPTSLGDF